MKKETISKAHPRRIVKVTNHAIQKDFYFWLPIIARAEAEGKLRGDSTNLELHLLIV